MLKLKTQPLWVCHLLGGSESAKCRPVGIGLIFLQDKPQGQRADYDSQPKTTRGKNDHHKVKKESAVFNLHTSGSTKAKEDKEARDHLLRTQLQ